MLGLSLWEGSAEKTENLDERLCPGCAATAQRPARQGLTQGDKLGLGPSLQDSWGCLG